MVDKFELYHAAQSWFAKNAEIYQASRHGALEILCKKIIEVMDVDRVGIWFYTIDKESVYEELTFCKTGHHSQGSILKKSSYPIYMRRISEERVFISHDSMNDPSLTELKESYLIPFKVYSLLDSPIFSDGDMIGIVCIEKTKNKINWDPLDKNFAASFSDLVGRLLESEKRHTYEKELRHRINYLENDLKKKLDDLNEAKLSLDLALEGAQVGKWEWELKTNQLILNKTWYTKLGYKFNELPQELDTFKLLLHPDDSKRVIDELTRHLRGESIFYECRFRMFAKNKEIQWCLDRGCIVERAHDGKPLRMIGVNINITPIVKLEQSALINEQQLKSMIQSLPTPVAMLDMDLKYLAYSSRWIEEWKDFGLGEIELNHVAEFRPEWLASIQGALSGKILSQEEDLVNFGNDKDIWLRWAIQPWRDPNQKIGGVIIMAENISARKEAEMKLTQASKLSALGEMAGGIAHEINNPLSIIKGYVDLLKRHSNRQSLSPELLNQYVAKMDQTVARISRIVNGMRRFSRESSLDEKVNYSLNKIVEETLDICQERISNNGTSLEVEFLKNDPQVFCRPVEISQVLLNLINNAFQATSSLSHPWIKIKIEDFHGFYRINVIDSGEKIPALIKKKLFQPFFTTKDVGLGTGLGLSISRGIIIEHKGSLYYKDEAPHTTFVIELPKLGMADTEISH